jgi:hypothetical protein
MRGKYSSRVEALFEASPRRSLPSNLSQLGIGHRANKKPRLIAGRGCVGSDTKLLCMHFCCRTGSTPRHSNTLSLFRYEYKDDSAASRRHGTFDKALYVALSCLDVRPLIKGYFSALRWSRVRSCLRPLTRRIVSAGPDVVR